MEKSREEKWRKCATQLGPKLADTVNGPVSTIVFIFFLLIEVNFIKLQRNIFLEQKAAINTLKTTPSFLQLLAACEKNASLWVYH